MFSSVFFERIFLTIFWVLFSGVFFWGGGWNFHFTLIYTPSFSWSMLSVSLVIYFSFSSSVSHSVSSPGGLLSALTFLILLHWKEGRRSMCILNFSSPTWLGSEISESCWCSFWINAFNVQFWQFFPVVVVWMKVIFSPKARVTVTTNHATTTSGGSFVFRAAEVLLHVCMRGWITFFALNVSVEWNLALSSFTILTHMSWTVPHF